MMAMGGPVCSDRVLDYKHQLAGCMSKSAAPAVHLQGLPGLPGAWQALPAAVRMRTVGHSCASVQQACTGEAVVASWLLLGELG
jgi:hypothetical protein